MDELRRVDLLVPAGTQQPPHVALDLLVDEPALLVPEHHARRLFLEVEEIELAPEAPVVAPLGLFQAVQIRLERLLVRPRGAVDTLEHLVARIAPPVGAGHLHELEGLEPARARHVRAAAQIDEPVLAIQRYRLFLGDPGDDLRLVILAHVAKEPDGLGPIHHHSLHREVPPGQLLHLGLDGLDVLRRERALEGEVVVEPILDHRTDGDLGLRIELLDGVRHQVGRRVTNDLEPLRVALGQQPDLGVVLDDVGGVDDAAIHLAGHGGPGEACADARGHLGDRHRRLELLLGPVGERDYWHDALARPQWWSLRETTCRQAR